MKWVRKAGLFTRWRDNAIAGTRFYPAVDNAFVVDVYQLWQRVIYGLPLWKRRVVVAELSVNQWIGTVTVGDPFLSPEQYAEFDVPREPNAASQQQGEGNR
jgi:hypothetical protein